MKHIRSLFGSLRAGRRPRRRGAAMVEFALTFGLFMIFFVATVEGGRLIWSWSTLAHATREAARYAMVHGEANPVDDYLIADRVKERAFGLVDADISVATTWADSAKTRGSEVEIDSTYAFRFVVNAVTNSQVITLRSRSRVRVAN